MKASKSSPLAVSPAHWLERAEVENQQVDEIWRDAHKKATGFPPFEGVGQASQVMP